jgi:hypothetical protein
MIWLILSSLGLAALVLALTAVQNGASPGTGLLIALVPGFWQSLQTALPEPIAAAMLIAGYLCVLRREWVLAGVCLAISLLIRETGVILVACVVVACLKSGKRAEALKLGLIATVPAIAWRLYVAKMLFSAYGAQAFFMNPEDLGVPFRGFVDLWTAIARGSYFPGAPEIARAGTWYPIVLTVGFVVSVVMAVRAPKAITVAAALYAALAISLNFGIWEGIGNGVRGTYELFITLALASTSIGTPARALRVGMATFWAGAATYVLVWAPDAAYLRDSVGWVAQRLFY